MPEPKDQNPRVHRLPISTGPVELAGLTWDQLKTIAAERLGGGHGFARRVHEDALKGGRFRPEALPGTHRNRTAWANHFALSLPEVGSVQEEPGDHGVTAKVVLRWPGGLETECVFLPMGRGRTTLCISTQVGCKMGCGFCETGRMGLLAHLRADQIISQLLVARHQLGWDFKNVVFMGMGEALDNAEAVIQALRVMTDSAGLAIAQQRLTVCTVGHVDGIRKLSAANFRRLNLSVSLNAPEDALRDELMPINRRYDLTELQAALKAYRPRPNFALGVNYCLLPGINDGRERARQIARFCEPLGRVLLNLIPYNPGHAPITRAPREDEITRFTGFLRDEGLPVRRRVTKGRHVMAACGQLGNVDLRTRQRAQQMAKHGKRPPSQPEARRDPPAS